MMGKDREAPKGGRDTNTNGKKAERGTENQNLGVVHRQEERKTDGGHVIDINRRRRGDSEGGRRWDNVYSLCVRSGQKTRGKRQRDMRPKESGDRTR